MWPQRWKPEETRHPHDPQNAGAKLQNIILVCGKENLPEEEDQQLPVD